MKMKILLAFVLAILLSTGCDQVTPPSPPDAGAYHTYQEVQTELMALQQSFPTLASVTSLGKSIQQREIWGIKISDNVASDEGETKVLFMGGHHAREWISVDVPLMLARHLLEQYAAGGQIKELVDNGEIWIVPMVNPDGHEYSVTSNRLWRKNRRNNGDGTYGVDLNRNYGYQWGGPGSSGSTYSETYRGTAPFSEPECQVLRDFMQQHQFTSMLSYHNYSQLVLYPWGYTSSPAPDKGLMDQLARTMADSIRNVHGKTYVPEQSSDLYLASGDATDWLYSETNAPSYTIELRPSSSIPGFQLPDNQIIPTFEENLPAALFLIQWAEEQTKMTTTM